MCIRDRDTYAVPNLSKELVLGGAGKILNHPEYSDIDKARQFLSVLETKDRLYQLLRRGSKLQFNITIGRELSLIHISAPGRF